MQTKQFFILWSLVKKHGKDNVIYIVNKIAKDIEIKKQKNKSFRAIYLRIIYSTMFFNGVKQQRAERVCKFQFFNLLKGVISCQYD